MQSGHATAFANVAQEAVERVAIGKDVALNVVEEDAVVARDPWVLQVVEIVREHRRERARELGHELQRQIRERTRPVVEAAVEDEIHHEERYRLLRRDEPLTRNRRIDSLLL